MTDNWNNVVSTAACYRLDSWGFEPRQGQEIFSSLYPSRLPQGPTQYWVPRLLHRGRAAGARL